jgi:hypothetical protein
MSLFAQARMVTGFGPGCPVHYSGCQQMYRLINAERSKHKFEVR